MPYHTSQIVGGRQTGQTVQDFPPHCPGQMTCRAPLCDRRYDASVWAAPTDLVRLRLFVAVKLDVVWASETEA